jgi:hypothetical protein
MKELRKVLNYAKYANFQFFIIHFPGFLVLHKEKLCSWLNSYGKKLNSKEYQTHLDQAQGLCT